MGDEQLRGVRIWLSGSVPDGDQLAAAAIPVFIAAFARAAFARGATIVHGGHPSIVPALLEAAAGVVKAGHSTPLVLAVSRLFSAAEAKHGISLEEWRRFATVEEAPVAREGDEKQVLVRSLRILRDAIAVRCDVVVAFGGRWWEKVRAQAGVPEEIQIAQQRGMPCFVLGGLGGAAKSFVEASPDLLTRCQNGLDAEANRNLAKESDAGRLVEGVLGQIARLPLASRATADGQPFRILALDGGGLRGMFTAAVLAQWELELQKKRAGSSIAQHFDLVAGTSTGGILAVGLGMGLTAQRLVQFYRARGAGIFPPASWFGQIWRSVRWVVRPKYDIDRLKREIRKAFADAPQGKDISASLCRLLVPAFNATSERIELFSTPHRDATLGITDAVTIATGTAAAPTYFRSNRVAGPLTEYDVIDGGVWANNPSLAALAEAVGPLGVPLSRVRLLSIGTTYGTSRLARTLWGLHGIGGWAPKVAGLLIKAGQLGVADQCKKLLEGRGDGAASGESWIRIDVPAATESLDDLRGMNEWATLGTDEARAHWPRIERTFLNGVPALPWS